MGKFIRKKLLRGCRVDAAVVEVCSGIGGPSMVLELPMGVGYRMYHRQVRSGLHDKRSFYVS